MKIDVSKIENYESLSAEEKVKLFEEMEIDDHANELRKLHEEMSKRNSQYADLKKQFAAKNDELDAKLSDEEKAAKAHEQEIADMKAELENLRREKTLSEYKGKLLGLGYDDQLASDTAQAYLDGDMNKVFENQSTFLTSHDKAFKAELMKGTPTPPAGAGSQVMTLDDFRKMPRTERLKYAQDHPEEYKKLYSKGE